VDGSHATEVERVGAETRVVCAMSGSARSSNEVALRAQLRWISLVTAAGIERTPAKPPSAANG
jgi:hypothetical protein